MTCPYFQKHSGFTLIVCTVFSSRKKKEIHLREYKCYLYAKFLLSTSYLPLYVVDTAVAILLLKSILVILNAGLATISMSR